MHRSGTSMLIGTLQEAGAYLGNVYGDAIEFNRKGLLEPLAVLHMHEDLLKANGGSWNKPVEQLRWSNLHTAVRDLFIESRAGHPVWAFKDPRTLFTLQGWQQVLPGLELVGIFRHPAAVAQSLQHRNKFPLDQGLALWQKYNQRLLALHERAAFPVIEFLPDPDQLRSKLASLLALLRLPKPLAAGTLTFFEEGIRQHDAADTPLPAPVEELYRRLQALAL